MNHLNGRIYVFRIRSLVSIRFCVRLISQITHGRLKRSLNLFIFENGTKPKYEIMSIFGFNVFFSAFFFSFFDRVRRSNAKTSEHEDEEQNGGKKQKIKKIMLCVHFFLFFFFPNSIATTLLGITKACTAQNYIHQQSQRLWNDQERWSKKKNTNTKNCTNKHRHGDEMNILEPQVRAQYMSMSFKMSINNWTKWKRMKKKNWNTFEILFVLYRWVRVTTQHRSLEAVQVNNEPVEIQKKNNFKKKRCERYR